MNPTSQVLLLLLMVIATCPQSLYSAAAAAAAASYIESWGHTQGPLNIFCPILLLFSVVFIQTMFFPPSQLAPSFMCV